MHAPAPIAPSSPAARPLAPPGPAAPTAPGRPALAAGLRAASAMIVPVGLAWVTGRPVLVVAALGGWLTSMADVGGAYRTRARVMGAYVVGGTCCFAVGTLVAPWHAVVVLLLFLGAAGGALLRVLGEPGAVLGTLLAVTLTIALDSAALPGGGHGTLPGAATAAALFAAGGMWAMLLALLVWPVRPWGPARDAVAAVQLRLAEYARALASAVRADAAPRLHELPGIWHPRVRTALEQARVTVLATRRARSGASRRADDVVLALALADDVFSALVAVTDDVDAMLAVPDVPPAVRAAAADVLDALAAALAGVAAALPSGDAAGTRPTAPLAALDAAVMRLWVAVEPSPLHATPAAHAVDASRPASQAAAVLEWAASLAGQAAEGASALAAGADVPGTVGASRRTLAGATAEWPAVPAGAPRERPHALRDAARAVAAVLTDPRHPVARFAVRLGLTVVAAHLLARALHVSRGLWVVTTVLLVLQPSAGLTRRRGMQRLLGTVAGGLLAALLAALLRTRVAVAAALFPLAVLAVTLRPVHYGLFTLFLTPVFVLLAEPAVGDWELAAERVLDTLLAGVLAVVASRALWPAWEHRALAGALGDAVAASRDYVQAAVRAASGEAGPDALARARRRAGLASNAAEAAVERLLDEPRGRWDDDDALLALLAHVRRVNGAATALATSHPAVPPDAALAATLVATLDAVHDALAAERAPEDGALLQHGAQPPGSGPGADPARVVLARVARHAAGVQAAAARLLGPRAR